MRRAFLSAVTVVAMGSFALIYRHLTSSPHPIMERLLLKTVIIRIRKHFYSTLREVSFIVSSLRTLEGDLDLKKIGQIVMRDGGNGQKRLRAIQNTILKKHHIDRESFEHSCRYYMNEDLEIKMLLQHLKRDLETALEGVNMIPTRAVHLLEPERVLSIHEQIIRRRMRIIKQRYCGRASEEECVEQQLQIQEYLQMEGVRSEDEANEKVLLGMVEHYYRYDSDFKDAFERLQMQMEMYLIQVMDHSTPTFPNIRVE